MIKITVCDWPYSEHGTKAKHEYCLDKDIYSIVYVKDSPEIMVAFNGCRNMLRIPLDDLKSITIERD